MKALECRVQYFKFATHTTVVVAVTVATNLTTILHYISVKKSMRIDRSGHAIASWKLCQICTNDSMTLLASSSAFSSLFSFDKLSPLVYLYGEAF